MNSTEERDYEKERDDLLKLMEEQIPREVKEAIEITISAQSVAELPQTEISYIGAFDAD